MRRLLFAAVFAASAASAAFATPPGTGPDTQNAGPEARQHVGHAARETGSFLRRGWEGTKEAAHETGNALKKGWNTIESGVRWGWNHPKGDRAPPAPDTGARQ